jgi:hypothetical protein
VAEGPARAAPSLDGTRTRAAKPAARWLSLDQIAEVPTTSMVRKVLACVEGAGTGPAPTTGQATVDQRRR